MNIRRKKCIILIYGRTFFKYPPKVPKLHASLFVDYIIQIALLQAFERHCNIFSRFQILLSIEKSAGHLNFSSTYRLAEHSQEELYEYFFAVRRLQQLPLDTHSLAHSCKLLRGRT